MKTAKNQYRLLAFVPHRDARQPLRAWSAALFSAGMPGAGAFPGVIPLAELNRPLTAEELKSLARALRQCINDNGGKLTAGPPALSNLSPDITLFGPAVPMELADRFFEPVMSAINRRTTPLVIGSALVPGALPDNLPPPPTLSLRAAALANMIYRIKGGTELLDGDVFEWKIGPLSWLPKKINNSALKDSN